MIIHLIKLQVWFSMLVVGEKIPLVGFILKQNFRNVTFYTKKVAFFCEDLIQEEEAKF